MKILIYACFLVHIFVPNAHAEGTESLSGRFIAYAIQGDLHPARLMLEEAGVDSTRADRDLAERFQQRFVDRTEPASPQTGDVVVDRVVTAYRDYWRAALMQADDRQEAEHGLRRELQSVLEIATVSMDGLPPADDFAPLLPLLQQHGYHALVSEAAPLQDLFVWREQETREFEVQLIDQARHVRVAFMSDFASLGWKSYASLGLATTTGWVEGNMLYCVSWAYAPGTENFEVSYLKHETQHLVDYERFPGLPSAELEYRAKLTELAFASTTLPRLLQDFSEKAAPNPDSPHAEANWRVVQDVFRAVHDRPYPGLAVWKSVDTTRVNRAARRLLLQNTERLSNG